MRIRTVSLTLGGLLAVLAASPARAQSTGRVTVTIPFGFTVGSKTMDAGQCEARMENSAVVLIRCKAGNAATYVLSNVTSSTKIQEHSKLVFHRYGDQLFLRQIWIAGDSSGRELPASPLERRAREAGEVATNVIVLAKR